MSASTPCLFGDLGITVLSSQQFPDLIEGQSMSPMFLQISLVLFLMASFAFWAYGLSVTHYINPVIKLGSVSPKQVGILNQVLKIF